MHVACGVRRGRGRHVLCCALQPPPPPSLPCVFQDGNVDVDSRCGVRVCQFTRHVRTQRQFNSTATGDENSAVANANGGGARVNEDGTPVRKVNAGCGTPEQRREFVGRTTESVKLFLERTGGAAKGGASQGKHARQVLKDISNAHGGAVMVSPEVLIKKARSTLKTPPVAPLVLPQMGRPRNLPAAVERAIVDHALAADDADAAYDVEALASVFSEFLGESVEGNDCLHKYKHCALSRQNIRDMVSRSGDAELDEVSPLDPARANAYFYSNFEDHYIKYAKAVVDQGLGYTNKFYDEREPLSEPVIITHPDHIVITDELALSMGNSKSERKQDNVRVVRKKRAQVAMIKKKVAFLEATEPDAGAPAAQIEQHVASMVRLKRRQKALSAESRHTTLVMSTTLGGRPLPFMVIFQADREEPKEEWLPDAEAMQNDFTFTVNGNRVQCLFCCSPSGGMTKELWVKYNRDIVVACISTNALGEGAKGMHMFDGDFMHNSADAWQVLADAECAGLECPPHLTHELQLQDAGEVYSTFQCVDYPKAKREVKRTLVAMQCDRDLGFSDAWRALKICFKKSFTYSRLVSAGAKVGLHPCTRRVLWTEEIQMMKGDAPPKCKQIDLSKIVFIYKQGEAPTDPKYSLLWEDDAVPGVIERKEAAAKELYRQLGGGRMGSSRFWQHRLDDPNMILVHRIYEYAVGRKKKDKAERWDPPCALPATPGHACTCIT